MGEFVSYDVQGVYWYGVHGGVFSGRMRLYDDHLLTGSLSVRGSSMGGEEMHKLVLGTHAPGAMQFWKFHADRSLKPCIYVLTEREDNVFRGRWSEKSVYVDTFVRGDARFGLPAIPQIGDAQEHDSLEQRLSALDDVDVRRVSQYVDRRFLKHVYQHSRWPGELVLVER